MEIRHKGAVSKKMEEAVNEILSEVAHFIFSKSQENLVKYKIWDTGFLARSGQVDSAEMLVKKVIYDAPYAGAIEYGTDPGYRPPHDALVAWCRRKLGMNQKVANKVAYSIAAKIEREGTDPRPYMRDAVNQAEAVYGKKVKIRIK